MFETKIYSFEYVTYKIIMVLSRVMQKYQDFMI